MATRFNYPHIRYVERNEMATLLGSNRYHGGVYDAGTGHIHPLKLLVGLAKTAQAAGAHLFENTKATKITTASGRVEVQTPRGTISAKTLFLRSMRMAAIWSLPALPMSCRSVRSSAQRHPWAITARSFPAGVG